MHDSPDIRQLVAEDVTNLTRIAEDEDVLLAAYDDAIDLAIYLRALIEARHTARVWVCDECGHRGPRDDVLVLSDGESVICCACYDRVTR